MSLLDDYWEQYKECITLVSEEIENGKVLVDSDELERAFFSGAVAFNVCLQQLSEMDLSQPEILGAQGDILQALRARTDKLYEKFQAPPGYEPTNS